MVKSVGSKEAIKALEAAGFRIASQKGSHVKLVHPDGRNTIVAAGRKDIPIGTVLAIERKSGVKIR